MTEERFQQIKRLVEAGGRCFDPATGLFESMGDEEDITTDLEPLVCRVRPAKDGFPRPVVRTNLTPIHSAPEAEETMPMTKQDFEKTLTKHLDQLRDEIQVARAKSVTLSEVAKAKWNATLADLEAKQKAARAKLGEVTESTGDAWEHLRDGAKHAWKDLESAVKQAVKEF